MQENTQVSMWPSASKNGFYLGVVMIVFQAVLYLADISMKSGLSNFSLVILGLGLFFATRHYRDQVNGGFISYGKAVGYGVLISMFSGIITAAFVYVLFKYIDVTLLDKLLLESEEQLFEAFGDEAKAEKAIEMNKMVMSPGFLAFGTLLNNVLLGLIISLIMSIFMKKKQAISTFEKETR